MNHAPRVCIRIRIRVPRQRHSTNVFDVLCQNQSNLAHVTLCPPLAHHTTIPSGCQC